MTRILIICACILAFIIASVVTVIHVWRDRANQHLIDQQKAKHEKIEFRLKQTEVSGLYDFLNCKIQGGDGLYAVRLEILEDPTTADVWREWGAFRLTKGGEWEDYYLPKRLRFEDP